MTMDEKASDRIREACSKEHLSSTTRLIKRNLLFVASISLIYTAFFPLLKVKRIAGFELDFKSNIFLFIMIILNFYLLIEFCIYRTHDTIKYNLSKLLESYFLETTSVQNMQSSLTRIEKYLEDSSDINEAPDKIKRILENITSIPEEITKYNKTFKIMHYYLDKWFPIITGSITILFLLLDFMGIFSLSELLSTFKFNK